MNRPSARQLMTLGATGAAALLLSAPSGPAPAPLEARASSCATVTPQSLQTFERSIERALRSAESDARANGASGAYAVAATNSRDLLVRSRNRIQDAVTFLQSSSPGSTTYAEAGQVKEYVRSTFEWLSQAGHWALVSAAYHRSTDARNTFEGSLGALGEAQRVYGDSGRCYISGWL